MKAAALRSWPRRLAAAMLLGLLTPHALFAHHSFAAEFDASKPIVLTGTVSSLAWTNPHARIDIDAADANGRATTWSFELSNPSAMARRGWSLDALAVGDRITIRGYLAKDGSHSAKAISATLRNGVEVYVGSNTPTDAQ